MPIRGAGAPEPRGHRGAWHVGSRDPWALDSHRPVVFTAVTDPIGSGLAASLARPGANVTGFTNFEFSMAGKWLELLKDVARAVRYVTIHFNPDNAAMPGQLGAIAQAATALGLQATQARVHNRGDI